MEILETNRGRVKLSYEGFLYVKKRDRSDGSIRWQCEKQKSGRCSGAVTTNGPPTYGDVSVAVAHNHDPDPIRPAVLNVRAEMKRAARTMRDERPSQIVINTLAQTQPHVRDQVGSLSVSAFLRDVHRQRNRSRNSKMAETEEKRRKMDSSYFRSYEDIGIHQEMISDEVRTNSYRLGILRASDHLIGKVVADVGAGTGVLSCFCCQAGAKKVYAIEASSMAEQAERVAQANAAGKIQVIRGCVEDIELPEKVDAIVSEWMGHFLLYESMLNSVIHARDKWLKEGGIILPSKADLYLAPITNQAFYTDRIDFWNEVKEKYAVDMSCVADHAREQLCSRVHVEEVPSIDLLARECHLKQFDLHTLTQDDLECIQAPFSFSCFGMEVFCGFAAWFDVMFETGVSIKEPVTISTSPDKHLTHWRQCSMYLDEPIQVEQDTIISGTITLTPGVENRRFLNVELNFQVNDGSPITKHYSMTDGS